MQRYNFFHHEIQLMKKIHKHKSRRKNLFYEISSANVIYQKRSALDNAGLLPFLNGQSGIVSGLFLCDVAFIH